jgi:hypothetical protein
MGWINEVNQRLEQQRQGTPARQKNDRSGTVNRESGQRAKKRGTWACTGCSVIPLLAALALCLHKNGGAESFAPIAASTIVLFVGWKADALGNQEKASGCGLLVLWIFLLLVAIGIIVGVAADS